MRGIFLPDGSFRSEQEIKREMLKKQETSSPIFETPFPQAQDFKYWSERMEKRQKQYDETNERARHVEIQFTKTTIFNFIGDIHAGSAETDYERIEREIETIINTPNSYVVLLGDIIDGYFFNPGQFEEIEQVPEQVKYYRSLVKYLSEKKRLLAGFSGDHDGTWQKKIGTNIYQQFAEETGAYYMEGVGYITAKINGIEYRIVAQHRPRGYSMYNNTHGAMRLSRETEGCDIVVVAHNHSKGTSQQPVKEYGGKSRLVTFLALGAYKRSDDYSRKMGYVDNTGSSALYGSSVILSGSQKQVIPFYDILEGNEKFLNFQEQ